MPIATASPYTPLTEIAVSQLRGVGKQTQIQLARLNLYTAEDLLFHLPLRYQDRRKLTPLNQLFTGMECLVEGQVQQLHVHRTGRRSITCQLNSTQGYLTLRFFHLSGHLQQQLRTPKNIRCFGEIRMGIHGLEMVHPEIQIVTQTTELPQQLTPIYPTTEGLHQSRLQHCIQQVLELLAKIPDDFYEILPKKIISLFQLGSLKDALLTLHQPKNFQELTQSCGKSPSPLARLAIEEWMAHHLSLLQLRAETKKQKAQPLFAQTELLTQFIKQLPFQLTHAQQRAFKDIEKDLATTQPMLRLIQGDVGSGKTLVAALTALLAVDNQQQVALMAPTEILAEQLFLQFHRWFVPLNIPIVWLTGKIKGQQRTATLEKIASGEAKMIVGTHALFQETVLYKSLSLIIIDEQHRFGVEQRLSLRKKGADIQNLPHQLMMTATPIPRTLAMALYVDLDVSVIDELPPGRQPITTLVMPETRRAELMERIKKICAEGKQVYWVCTLIEASDTLTYETANHTYEQLQRTLPQLRIGLIHGQLKSPQKAEIMEAFKVGSIDLLVSTTVIEVGVDVPNAICMIIENSERLGLAQLHQLRGRVGRGKDASYCILLYQIPLSFVGKQRLGFLKESSDGFYLAEKDLELRGAGEILGTRQTGELAFRVAELARDQALLPLAKQGAEILLAEFPEHTKALIRRWLGYKQAYLLA